MNLAVSYGVGSAQDPETTSPLGARRKWRSFGIAAKIWLTFGTIFVAMTLGALASSTLLWRLNEVVSEAIGVAEQLNAAAYEMEINTIGSGMGVLKYLKRPNPDYVSRFDEDVREFAQFHAVYDDASNTPELRNLAKRIGELFARYAEKGKELIATKNREITTIERLRAIKEELDSDRNGNETKQTIDPDLHPILSRLIKGISRYSGIHSGSVGADIEKLSQHIEWLNGAAGIQHDTSDKQRAPFARLFSILDDLTEARRIIDNDFGSFIAMRIELDDLLDEEIQRLTGARFDDAAGRAASFVQLSAEIQIIVLAITLLLGLFLSSRFSRGILRSIAALSKGTEAFGQGQLDFRIAVRSDDEFGALGVAFNRMADTIAAGRNELEARVQERTAELHASNQQLKHELAVRATLERQLLQSQKLESLGTFAGGVAHDFNNMLQVILTNATLAQDQLAEDVSSPRERLARVVEAAERSRELIQRLLSFGRQTEPDLRVMASAKLLRECVGLMQAVIPSTIDIELNTSADCGPIRVDVGQIQQVVLNLGANAVHAIGQSRGNIRIETRTEQLDVGHAAVLSIEPGAYVVWMFSDTGCGIAQEHLDRVFDPFFTTKRVGEGSGLGLSVVHGVVESHRGAITLTSEVGRGTTATIYLPIVDNLGGDSK